MKNTVILVDYDNVFVTLERNYETFQYDDLKYSIIEKIRERYKDDNILCYQLFLDFQKCQISDSGYDLLRKNQTEIMHVFSGKNASDVVLMLKCMEFLNRYPHIDRIVIVSSDSDIAPLFREVRLLNKEIEVIYFDYNCSKDYEIHIEQLGLKHEKIENILGLDTYIDSSNKDFADKYLKNTALMELILQKINDILLERFNEYTSTDSNGVKFNSGNSNLGYLGDKIKEQKICPTQEIFDKSFINLLLNENIIYVYEYTIDKKPKKTVLINKTFINEKGLIISNLLEENHIKKDIEE